MAVVHLLSNPEVSSRTRLRRLAEIRAALEARGHELIELQPASPDLIAPTIQEARHHGVTRLVIAGGDGLVHQCLPAIAGSDVPVGIVAAGTGNDFARALGLPTDPDGSVAAALADPVPVDLITIESRPGSTPTGDETLLAASVVTGGFSGGVNARANRLRFPRGRHRYTVATLVELASLDAVSIDLVVDGEHHQLESSLFAIGNTRYFGGGMDICPDAAPTDGVIDVTVVGAVSRFTLATVLPRVFSGRHVDHPAVTTYRGERIELSTDADLWADGEPLPTTATTSDDPAGRWVTFTVASGALHVAGSLVGSSEGLL